MNKFTQRSREYREKLELPENIEKLKNFKSKQNENYKKYVKKQLENEDTAEEFRANARDRKRKSRANLKDKEQEIHNNFQKKSAFSSKSSKSKAIAKCIQSLPSNIDKQKEIISICSKRLKIDQQTTSTQIIRQKSNNFKHIETTAIDFYSIDLISKQLPGIKDFITIKDTSGDKIQIQKRVLLMSLSDAYAEFTKSFPDLKISFSKFCSLRPLNVSLFSTEIHYSCLCVHCENFKLLLDGLSQFLIDPKINLDIFMSKITCDDQNYDCVSGNCNECMDIELSLKSLLRSCCLDETTKYKEWKKNDGYMQKVLNSDVSVKDILKIILNDIKDFKVHRYLKNVQRKFFFDAKTTQNDDSVTIVVDFSENFSTKAQHEIQSSYFGRKQISLYTAVAWIGTRYEESFVIASDNSRHSKEQVAVYMSRIFNKLKQKYPKLQIAKIFSDGAASQFKNHFVMSTLLYGKEDFCLDLEWHFFSTSHGKSSADGLGGVVKRGVYNRMLTGKWDIYTAKDFVDCSRTFIKNIDVFEVTEEEVKIEIDTVQKRWIKSKTLPGMQKRHFFKASLKENYILMAKSSIGDDISELKIF